MIEFALFLALGDLPPASSFSPWFERKGVAVEIARGADGIPWVRGTATLPVPPEAVAAVVADTSRYKEIFEPALAAADVLDSGEGWSRLHLVWPYPFPLRDRDAVVVYRFERAGGGAFRATWRTDERPGDPRRGVRIQAVAGETWIEPLGGEDPSAPPSARVVYTFLGDLGAKLPEWAEEKAWRAEPVGYIMALRRALGLPLSGQAPPP